LHKRAESSKIARFSDISTYYPLNENQTSANQACPTPGLHPKDMHLPSPIIQRQLLFKDASFKSLDNAKPHDIVI
jgi:hypothetical protein